MQNSNYGFIYLKNIKLQTILIVTFYQDSGERFGSMTHRQPVFPKIQGAPAKNDEEYTQKSNKKSNRRIGYLHAPGQNL